VYNQSAFREYIEAALKVAHISTTLSVVDTFTLGFPTASERIQNSTDQLFLLENTRFWSGEQSKNTDERMKQAEYYRQFGTYFVDDAFAVNHRHEATNTEIKHLLPHSVGLAFQGEIDHLAKLTHPVQPYTVILGGAKLETKLPLIAHLLPLVDHILLAGEPCFTFIAAHNEINNLNTMIPGFVDQAYLDDARKLIKEFGSKIVLPTDFMFDNTGCARDIGPATIAYFSSYIKQSKTIFWNGPVGLYETKPFDTGTVEIGKVIAGLEGCYTVIGGGDTVASASNTVTQKFNFVSMGGGATLTYLTNPEVFDAL
jgi:phosphoglycerate kinase